MQYQLAYIKRLDDIKLSSQGLFGYLANKSLLGRAGVLGGRLRTMAVRFVQICDSFQ